MAPDHGSGDHVAHLARLSALFDALPMPAFFKDADGHYLEINESFVEAYGGELVVSKDDIIGTSDFDHMPRPDAEMYHLKDREVLEGQPIEDLHEELVHEDGTVDYFRTTKRAMHDEDGRVLGLYGFSIPWGDSRQVNKAVAESEKRHRLALRASRDGIWEFDASTLLLHLNARACELLGRSISDNIVEPHETQAVLSKASYAALAEGLAAVMADFRSTISLTVDATLPDGRPVVFELEGAALNEAGRTTKIIGAITDITDAVENERRLAHLAMHDDLTGLPNRRALAERVASLPSDTEWSLLFCDLDDFKIVNDSLGHQAGDELLIGVADLLRAITRDSDDLVARLGGDEFAVLTRGRPESPGVAAMSRRILDELSVSFAVAGTEIYTSVSIGVAGIDEAQDADRVLRDADTAMYHAKRNKLGVRSFAAEMRAAAVSEQRLQTDLRLALERDEFLLHYQPLVDAESHEMTSVEALLRWQRADGSLVAPGVFLPFLERTGLIVEAGEWVIGEAARQVARWRAAGRDDLRVAVNLSRVQLSRSGITESIIETMARHGVPGDGLTFEVTETAIAGGSENLVDTLARLRETGALIAIDDFGVGQSCLSNLDMLPVDVLKIDKSFVDRIDDGDTTVLSAILALAAALGLETVAEGVETASQADFLTDHGCSTLQGYHFGRPAPPDEVVVIAAPASVAAPDDR